MQYDPLGPIITAPKPCTVSAIASNNPSSQDACLTKPQKLTLGDKAGLVFVIVVLLLLQLMERLKLLK